MVMNGSISQTTYIFVVLHPTDEPPANLHDAIVESEGGHAVGWTAHTQTVVVDDASVPDALRALGNDGSFFDDDYDYDGPHAAELRSKLFGPINSHGVGADRVITYCVTCEAVREQREPGGDIQLIQTDADQAPTDPELWAELVVNLTGEDVPAFHDATHILTHEPVTTT